VVRDARHRSPSESRPKLGGSDILPCYRTGSLTK
jgi:hypothetical protein